MFELRGIIINYSQKIALYIHIMIFILNPGRTGSGVYIGVKEENEGRSYTVFDRL